MRYRPPPPARVEAIAKALRALGEEVAAFPQCQARGCAYCASCNAVAAYTGLQRDTLSARRHWGKLPPYNHHKHGARVWYDLAEVIAFRDNHLALKKAA